MKKTLLLIALLAIAGFVAYNLSTQKKDSSSGTSLALEGRDFAIENIDDVASITIQRGKEKGYLLTRKGDRWYINEKYLVATTKMPQILQVLSKIRINTIPNQKALPVIKKHMKTKGIKIKAYDEKGNIIKSYTIGSESSTQNGTYFMMDGYTQPYNMYMPGFEGVLRPRFLQPIDNWRDLSIYAYKPEDIQSVRVDYHKSKGQSFVLEMDGDNPTVRPTSHLTQDIKHAPVLSKVKAYLGAFSQVYVEAYDNDNVRKDTISSVLPFATITITDTGGKKKVCHYTPFIDLLDDDFSTSKVEDMVDVERYFVREEEGDFMVTQQRMTKDLFVPYDFFFDQK